MESPVCINIKLWAMFVLKVAGIVKQQIQCLVLLVMSSKLMLILKEIVNHAKLDAKHVVQKTNVMTAKRP